MSPASGPPPQDPGAPSLDMPTSKHFWRRQNWQRLRVTLLIWQFLSRWHVYTMFFWMLRRKKPWGPRTSRSAPGPGTPGTRGDGGPGSGRWQLSPCSPRRRSPRSGTPRTCPGRRSRACRCGAGAGARVGWARSPPSWCSASRRLQGRRRHSGHGDPRAGLALRGPPHPIPHPPDSARAGPWVRWSCQPLPALPTPALPSHGAGSHGAGGERM